VEFITVDAETATDLRSALLSMRSDDYETWYRMGLALKELGDIGRGMWLEWSSTSTKYNAAEAACKWNRFDPDRTGYQAVFAEAQRLGWINPRSKAAQPSPQSTEAPAHRFRLLCDQDLQQLQRPRWLVKRIVPDTGIGAIYSQSQCFKSFLVLDLLAHISNGMEWFGHRVTAAPTVYVPFEGQGGVPKRIQAWRLAQADAQERPEAIYSVAPDDIRSNIAVIMDKINLREQVDRDILVATLTENGWAGGVLCIDTLAHASNGIEENSSEMGEMIAVLSELQRRLGGVVLVIHHAGKDENKGMRGWSGIHAAMDFIIECQRPDKQKMDARFMLTKVKDDEDGKLFDFSVKKVHIGYDEDGDEITSLTLVPPPERQGREIPATSIEQDREDDQFVWQWVYDQVAKGEYPSANSLEGQRAQMGLQHKMSQKRLRDAIHRLRAASRLVTAPIKSLSGNAYLRAMEMPHVAV
jgi:RecA-family ATPase